MSQQKEKLGKKVGINALILAMFISELLHSWEEPKPCNKLCMIIVSKYLFITQPNFELETKNNSISLFVSRNSCLLDLYKYSYTVLQINLQPITSSEPCHSLKVKRASMLSLRLGMLYQHA